MSSNPKTRPSRLWSLRPSQFIFGIQAAPLLASGVYTVLWPDAATTFSSSLRGLDAGTIQAMGLTSVALGTCQTIAAYQNNIPIMIAAVPGRLLAALMFYRSGGEWRKVAPFEGIMGILITIGVYWTWHIDQTQDKVDRSD